MLNKLKIEVGSKKASIWPNLIQFLIKISKLESKFDDSKIFEGCIFTFDYQIRVDLFLKDFEVVL